eukprot:jgi/Ulvmu1/5964/UM026_0087.1
MHLTPVTLSGRAAAAALLAACMTAALLAACMTTAAAERLVMTKLSQLYLPFEMGSDGEPRFCFGQGLAEQITYHPPTQQAIAASSKTLQLLDMGNVSAPVLTETIDMGAGVTDVEVCGDLAAASLENPESAVLPGSVRIFTISAGGLEMVAEVTAGALPDMITFTPDCSTILTANEGEAGQDADGVFVNPEGSVSIISVEAAIAGTEGAVREAGFTEFNDQAEELIAQGVRWIWRGQGFLDPSAFPEQTFSKDLEPEFIALSKDGKTAFVALQENNAIAVVDVAAAEVTSIQPLAFKAWADIGAQADLVRGNDVSLQPWNHFGVFQPDSIVSFSVNGKDYIALANEGDTKEYEITADVEWTEEANAPDIAGGVNASLPAFFGAPNVDRTPLSLADALADILEDLTVSTVDGGPRSIDGEAVTEFEKVITFGARSFSILEVQAGGKLAMVYDSGQELEARHHTHWPQLHNTDFPDPFCAPNPGIAAQFVESEDPEALFIEIAKSGVYEDFAEYDDGEIEVPDFLVSNFAGERDRRSARKGPETEAVTFAEIGGRPVLFVANERPSTVFLYDISDPTKPVYQDSVYGGPVDSDMTFHQLYEARMLGDVDPESLAVIKAADSPTGNDLLIIAGSFSGTVSVYEITAEPEPEMEPTSEFPCEAAPTATVLSVARALGVTLGDINPGSAFPTSSPTPFITHSPAPGTFAVPGGADAGAADLSVPQYSTDSVLSGGDCRGRGESEICFDSPGLFSGFTGPMSWCKQPNSFGVFGLGSGSGGTSCPFGNEAGLEQGLLFMGMTDRGPNQGCDDVAEFGINVLSEASETDGSKGFPVPDFSPAMTFLELDAASGVLQLLKACPLRGVDGTPVTGVSGDAGVDVPFTKDCAAPLDFAPFGMDPEEVQPIGHSGWCLLVEEFSPSVAVARCDPRGDACGTVHTRYVPEGSEFPADGPYTVVPSLPSELSFRIPNRGLETVVVSPDGTSAFAFMQSPLLGDDAAELTTNTTTLRVLRLAIGNASSDTVPPEVTVEAMHVYSFDAFPLWTEADSNRRVLVSAAYWLGDDHVLVAERSTGQVKLFDADFGAAADLLQSTARNDDPAALAPELLFNDGAVSEEVRPAGKELVMDSAVVEGWEARGVSAKQEGVALVNACVVALAEDNDFGLEGQPVSSVAVVQLERCLPSYAGALYDTCA